MFNIVQCSIFNVHIQCSMFNVQCSILFNVHVQCLCSMFIVQRSCFIVQCSNRNFVLEVVSIPTVSTWMRGNEKCLLQISLHLFNMCIELMTLLVLIQIYLRGMSEIVRTISDIMLTPIDRCYSHSRCYWKWNTISTLFNCLDMSRHV